jgi:hypothetical protein
MRRFFCRAARGGRRVGIALVVALLAGLTSVAAGVPSAPSASALSTSGYWLVGTDGGIFSFGKSAFLGSTGSIKLNQPIVGMASTPDGRGYWMVASDGGIFAFGNAGFYGSMGGKPLNQPIIGMASTRTGKGYWLVASDGGIFSFGDAGFFGSTGSIKLNKPIVDIVPTPTGKGYWMAASDGGIFSFGDAGFFGSTGSIKLARRIQQMAASPTGKGYWMVAGDGGIFAFGDAAFFGSTAGGADEKRIVDMAPSATGKGYYLTASNGAVYPFGDAKSFGSLEGQRLNHGIIAMVALNGGEAPVVSNDSLTIAEDGSGIVDVLANDRDPDGGPLSIQSILPPGHGTATAGPGGITYKPAPNFNGTDTFSYIAADPNGLTSTGVVSVTVSAIDDFPAAIDDIRTIGLHDKVTIPVLTNDSIGDGLLSLDILPPFARGTVEKSADGRAIVYTATHKGADTIRYRIVDLDGENSAASVKIEVTGQGPKAVDVGPIDCSAGACSTNLADASGIYFGNQGTLKLVGEAGDGTKAVNGGVASRDGNVVSFRAANGGAGLVEIEYEIVDVDGDSSKALIRFNYQNSAPTAVGGGAMLAANAAGDFQLGGADADGDTFTFLFDGVEPAGPAVSIDPNGMLHFGGAPTGTWRIRFRVIDAQNVPSDTAEFVITVP